jgi:hypothetical protein
MLIESVPACAAPAMHDAPAATANRTAAVALRNLSDLSLIVVSFVVGIAV